MTAQWKKAESRGTDSFTLCIGYLYLIQSLVCSVNWGILITFLCSDAMAFRLQKEGITWAHGFMRIESITITVGKPGSSRSVSSRQVWLLQLETQC